MRLERDKAVSPADIFQFGINDLLYGSSGIRLVNVPFPDIIFAEDAVILPEFAEAPQDYLSEFGN